MITRPLCSMRAMAASATLLISSSTALTAQSPAPAVTLEVSSIRPSPPGTKGLVPGNWGRPASPNARLRPMTLRTLVMYTFDWGRHDPVPIGGPDWIDQNLYELTLRFSATPTLAEARNLIRMLLEDRFKLKWHREQREAPVYVLTLARPDGQLGPGLVPSKVDCGAYSDTLARTGRGVLATAVGEKCGLLTIASPSQNSTRGTATMREIVQGISRSPDADRKIVDRTGLTGTFEINLTWAIDVVSFFTAVQEQLGLKLEPRREPVDIVVIDAAELPEPD